MNAIDIVTLGDAKRGWGPIEKMADLATKYLGGTRVRVPEREKYSKLFDARALVPRQRGGDSHAVLIAGVPGQLRALLEAPLWRGKYSSVSAWVIDSFWDDRVPRLLRDANRLDHVWVADQDDQEPWNRMFPGAVGVLPWGTDAVGAQASASVAKDLDLTRVGRQPDAFDDDDATAALAESRGIRFAGRPPFGESVAESQALLESFLARSKGILAFTNLVDSTTYTHPTKEYITGRWTDALAHGAAAVGKRPNTPTSQELIPDFARVEIDHQDPKRALGQYNEWLQEWTPETAQKIREYATGNLDWRLRFDEIAATLGISRLG